MTATRSALALLAACAASVTLVGCGGESSTAPTTSSTTSSSAAPVIVMPTIAELNDVMARLLDPQLPQRRRYFLLKKGIKPVISSTLSQVQPATKRFVLRPLNRLCRVISILR